MSIEYKTYTTQLRDGVAMRLMPKMLEFNLALVATGEDGMSNEQMAQDAWELADAFVLERERRYGPMPSQDIQAMHKGDYVIWSATHQMWWGSEPRTHTHELARAGRFEKVFAQQAEKDTHGKVVAMTFEEALAKENANG